MKPISQAITLLSAVLLAVTLQSCATSSRPERAGQSPLPHPHTLFGNRPVVPDSQSLFALEPQQQEALNSFMAAAPQQDRHRRLYDYLERITDKFNYQEDTLTASEALKQQRGNCLTLAILTTALARHAGIDVGYQLVNDVPVYEFAGSFVVKGVHVRSRLYDPEWLPPEDHIVFSRPGISVDYFPSGRERFIGNLDEADFIAMYYSNMAADFLKQKNFSHAYWYAQQALAYSPDNTDTINLLAVIARQKGAEVYAEQLYRYGIEQADNKLSLLKNYHILLLGQNRQQEARQVELKLNTMDDPSPFHWFLLAQDMLDNNNPDEAIRYYNKALEIAPYLHEAWFGLARAEYLAGRPARARADLRVAMQNASRPRTIQTYKAKLISLDRETE